MPTENELKYVLSCVDSEGFSALNDISQHNHVVNILQGYLVRNKTSCRIRHSMSTHSSEYTMTVKRSVGNRIVEIETSIDQRDFDDLWNVCKGKLQKTRVYVEDWEVDFFLDLNGIIYFVVAEHEMPEGQEVPHSMTPFVKDNLLFEVPRGDDRFSNKKLGKVKYARKLLASLKGIE